MNKNQKLKVFQIIKLHVITFGSIGLLFGIIYSFGGLLIDTLVSLELIQSSQTPGLSYGTILAFGALIGMPLLGGLCGLGIGIIVGVTYSIISKFFGIKINF